MTIQTSSRTALLLGLITATSIHADPAGQPVVNGDGLAPSGEQRAQAEISIREDGHWADGKYVGGSFVNVDALVVPPEHGPGSGYIRYEGPGIESDLVGYRVYLDHRNGFDIFGKKTPEMVLQHVGQDGAPSYHEPADWGMDVLKVGESVGMGGFGFWDGQQLLRVEDAGQRSVEIIEKGPLAAAFELVYEDWKVGGTETDLAARLAMHGGSRLVHTRLSLSEPLDNIAVGIVKHPGTTLLTGELDVSGDTWTWVASWGRQSLADDHLGMVVLFRGGDLLEQTEDEHNYVTVLKPRDGELEYYFGAAWEQEPNGVADEAAFRALVSLEAEQLTRSRQP
jgi:hypothetical protein